MSAIQQALAKLDNVVGKLEGSMVTLETTVANANAATANGQGQSDMFTSSVSNENGTVVDGAVVAQRLDSAIEKVETLLKENQG